MRYRPLQHAVAAALRQGFFPDRVRDDEAEPGDRTYRVHCGRCGRTMLARSFTYLLRHRMEHERADHVASVDCAEAFDRGQNGDELADVHAREVTDAILARLRGA